MFEPKPAVELHRLREERTQLTQRSEAAEQELADLRSVNPDAVLDAMLSPEGDERRSHARQRIAALEADVQDLRVAERALLARIRAAIIAVAHDQAEKKRTEATKLEAELEKHRAVVQEHLKKAAELEGGAVEYVRRDAIAMLPVPGLLFPGPPMVRTKSDELLSLVAQLRAEADRIESDAATQAKGGSVAAESLEVLLAGAAEHPLAPAPREIRAWFARVRTQADQHWAREQATWYPPVDRVTRYTLAWTGDGTINEEQSAAVNSHLSRPVSIYEAPAHPPRPQPPRNWYPAA